MKVILATNIAESSVTINDVLAVVDSGLVREMSWNAESGMSTMQTVTTSRASATQRTGRAGRVAPGSCYRIYSHGTLHAMAERPTPEIQRTALEATCLQTCSMTHDGVQHFLSKAMDPPSDETVEYAMDRLFKLGAIKPNEASGGEILTPMGRLLSVLPLDPGTGRMLIMGAVMKCLDPVLTAAACFSSRDPFYVPPGMRDEAREIRQSFCATSDLLATVRAYDTFQDVLKEQGWDGARRWASDNLSPSSPSTPSRPFGPNSCTSSTESDSCKTTIWTAVRLRRRLCATMPPSTTTPVTSPSSPRSGRRVFPATSRRVVSLATLARCGLGRGTRGLAPVERGFPSQASARPHALASLVPVQRDDAQFTGVSERRDGDASGTAHVARRSRPLQARLFRRRRVVLFRERIPSFTTAPPLLDESGQPIVEESTSEEENIARPRTMLDDWIVVDSQCADTMDLLTDVRREIDAALALKVMSPRKPSPTPAKTSSTPSALSFASSTSETPFASVSFADETPTTPARATATAVFEAPRVDDGSLYHISPASSLILIFTPHRTTIRAFVPRRVRPRRPLSGLSPRITTIAPPHTSPRHVSRAASPSTRATSGDASRPRSRPRVPLAPRARPRPRIIIGPTARVRRGDATRRHVPAHARTSAERGEKTRTRRRGNRRRWRVDPTVEGYLNFLVESRACTRPWASSPRRRSAQSTERLE